MKKFILSALFLGAVMTAQAQTNLTGTAATTRAVLSMSAQEMTRQMYNDLQLNEGQYIKIKALNQARHDKFSEIEKMYSNDPQMREAKIKEVNDQLDQEFAQVLTPKQFTSYLEMEGRPVEQPATNGTMNSGTSTSDGSTGTSATVVEGDMKVSDDKMKMENGETEIKIKDDKMKVETAEGEMKIKSDSEKLKTGSVKYKSSPSETKIKSAQGKTKVEHDKMKTKTATTEKKVKN